MSGTTTTPTTPDTTEATVKQEWIATLVRGRYYATPNLVWDADDPKWRDKKNIDIVHPPSLRIDQGTKDWLEEHAVDMVSVEGEGEFQRRPKFEFVAAPKPAPARQR